MSREIAEKLVEDMRVSAIGWGFDDIESALTGFGFVPEHKGRSTTFIHPDNKNLRLSVQKGTTVRNWLPRDVVALVDKYLQFEADKQMTAQTHTHDNLEKKGV